VRVRVRVRMCALARAPVRERACACACACACGCARNARARVYVCACVCACGCAHSGALHSRERMTCAVRSTAQQAHRMISDAYGSGDCQIGRSVVMMASADEGWAGGLGRRQHLDNLQPPRQPQGLGVRLIQRAHAILCDVPADCFILFHTIPTSCAPCCRIWAWPTRPAPRQSEHTYARYMGRPAGMVCPFIGELRARRT